MQQPETKYVVRPDGASIAYQIWGAGPVDLFYSPGFVSHVDLLWGDPGYTRFFERLGSIARVITFDKLGTGCSDQISYVPSLEERTEDIRLVLDTAGSERAVMMGFSEGGPPCALLAAGAPERVSSLILYGSFARGPGTDLEPELHARWWAKKPLLDTMIAEWGSGRSVEFFAPSAVGRFQRRAAAVFERAAASPGMMAGLLEVVERTDIRTVLPSVRVPTLILHRSGDPTPVEAGRELAELIPGARFVELPGTDHAFWFGDFGSIAEEIEGFVVGGHPSAPVERVLATLLFTDIVDSTEVASSLGDSEWRALLERHDAIVRNAVERRGGRLVKSMGDGALATFGSPANAVRCGIELSETLTAIGLPIRAGVHTGECELIGDDVGGLAVHIGARVGAKADAGEILVSSTVAELVLGSGLTFEERGAHELKGVPGQWRLMAVVGEGEPRSVVERHAPAARPGNRVLARIGLRFPGMVRATTRITGRRS